MRRVRPHRLLRALLQMPVPRQGEEDPMTTNWRAGVPGTALLVDFDDLIDGGTVRITNTRDGSTVTMWSGDWEALVDQARKIRGTAERVDRLPADDRPSLQPITIQLDVTEPTPTGKHHSSMWSWRPGIPVGSWLTALTVADPVGQPIVRLPFVIHDDDASTIHTICNRTPEDDGGETHIHRVRL